MKSSIMIAISCVALTISMTSVSAIADTALVNYSTIVTLPLLVQSIYKRHPSHQSHTAHQLQIDANNDFANATFADVNSLSLKHHNDVVGSSNGFQEWEGSVNMPLWLSGQKQSQHALSDTLLAELTSVQQQLKLDISAQIRQVVWDVVLAELQAKQAKQTWNTAQKLEADVDAYVKAGEVAGTELLLANSYALKAHSDYLRAKGQLEYALDAYQQLTGKYELPHDYEEELSIEAVISNEHPSLVELDRQVNTLRIKQDIARYQDAVNPSLSVGVRRERGDNSESFNHSVGLGVTFALDNDVYRRPAMANAAINLANVEIKRQQLERKLQIELAEQLHQLDTMKKQLILAVKHSDATEKYLFLQQRAFDLGEIDLLALLTSQTLATESSNEKQLLESRIKHTVSKVNQALGIVF